MKRSQDPVRADLAYLGPTLFVQEYRRRGWSEGEMAGVMAGAGVSAGKIHEVLSRGRERVDLARLGPMNFVQEYRRRGWRDGDLAGVMAREGVSAGKIRQALSQPKTESKASRAWRALENASDTTARVAREARRLGKPDSPLRVNSKGAGRKPDYGRLALQQEEEEQRVRDLPPDEYEALLRQRMEEGAKQREIPEGRRPSTATQVGAVAEQVGLGVLGGAAKIGWDTMAQLEAIRAPLVRLRIQQLRKQGGPEAQAEADFLEQNLPENLRKTGKRLKSDINRLGDSRLTPDRVSAPIRINAQMARTIASDVVVPAVAKKYVPSLTPSAVAGRAAEESLRAAPWMQPILRAARRRGLDEALVKALAGVGPKVAEQIVDQHQDPANAIEEALRAAAKRGVTEAVKSRSKAR